jgi:hypothetical protein
MANALLVSRPRRASNQAMAVQRHSLRAQQAPQAYLTILNSYGALVDLTNCCRVTAAVLRM